MSDLDFANDGRCHTKHCFDFIKKNLLKEGNSLLEIQKEGLLSAVDEEDEEKQRHNKHL